VASLRVDPRVHFHGIPGNSGSRAQFLDLAVAGEDEPRAFAQRLRQSQVCPQQIERSLVLAQPAEKEELYLTALRPIRYRTRQRDRFVQDDDASAVHAAALRVELAPVARQNDQLVGPPEHSAQQALDEDRLTFVELVEAAAVGMQDERPPGTQREPCEDD